MSQQGQQIPWRWDRDSKKWFYYDAQRDDLVFEDGHRFKRPESIPRTAFTAAASAGVAGPADYAHFQAGQNEHYTTQAPGIGQNFQQLQQPRSTPQASGGGQRIYTTPPIPTANTVSSITQETTNLSLRPSQAQPTGTTSSASPGSHATTSARPRFVDHTNPETGVRTLIETGPLDRITDPRLAGAGVFAQEKLLDTNGDVEPLYENYRRRTAPRNYFVRGRVFFILWAEPAGTSNSQATGAEAAFRPGRHGQQVYSKIRRFVVVLEGNDFCTCLPITTYGRQGVAKRGVTKSHHSIIHTSRHPPAPLPAERAQRGEENMQPEPIRIDADDPSDKLTELSRLDYGKFYTIHHNLKVRNLGKVNPNSLNAFVQQFHRVTSQRAATGMTQANTIFTIPTVLAPIAENSAPQRRRASDAGHHRIQAERVAQGPNARENFPAPRAQPGRRHFGQGAGDDSSSNDDNGNNSDSASDDEQPTNSEARRSNQAELSSVQAAAASRLVRRGFSAEAASEAVARQAQVRRDAGRREEGNGSQSDDSSEGRARTHRSGRSRGSTDRPSDTTRSRQAGNDRNDPSRSGPSANSQSRGRVEATQRQQNRNTHNPIRPNAQSTSSQPRVQPGTGAGPSTERTTQVGPATSRTISTTTGNARLPEADIQNLVNRGYTRNQAIAALQQRYGSGGSR